MSSMLERLEGILRGEAPPPPIAQLLGLRLTAITAGAATFEVGVDERLTGLLGAPHRGIVYDIAGAAMGFAYLSLLQEGETFTNLEMHVNFVRPLAFGTLTAVGRVVNAGDTIGLAECDVTDAGGNLIAQATGIGITLRGERATGR